jgi:hypothetical protein
MSVVTYTLNSTTRAARWVSELNNGAEAGGVALYTGQSILCQTDCNAVRKQKEIAILCIFQPSVFLYTRCRDPASHQPPRSLPDVSSKPQAVARAPPHRCLPLASVSRKPLPLLRARARAQQRLPTAHRPPLTMSSHPAREIFVYRVQVAPRWAPAAACHSERCRLHVPFAPALLACARGRTTSPIAIAGFPLCLEVPCLCANWYPYHRRALFCRWTSSRFFFEVWWRHLSNVAYGFV